MSDPWLASLTVPQLALVKGISEIILKTGLSNSAVEETDNDITYELERRSHRKHKFQGYPSNGNVDAWLSGKKREYKKR